MSTEQPDPSQYTLKVQWDHSPYTQPQLVNQIQMATGLDTSSGPDGLIYIQFGHVLPPSGQTQMDENGDPVATVLSQGTFALTKYRAIELRDILNQVLSDMSSQEQSQGG